MNKLSTLLAAGALAISLSIQAKGYVPEIWGNIIQKTSWDNMSEFSKPYGVYSFKADPTDFKFTQLSSKSSNFYATGNGIITSDGKYNFIVYEFDEWYYDYYTQLYRYDTKTWTIIGSPKNVAESFRAFDMTEDPTDGTVYGYFIDGTAYRFGTIDFDKIKQKFIATSDTAFYGLACNNEGQLYAISAGGNLFKIDKTNGEQTLVGSLGLEADSLRIEDRVQSATFDPRTDKLYWSAYLWDSKNKEFKTGLYEIDTTTGKANLVVSYPEVTQVVALYIARPEANDAAPAKVDDISADFVGASLSGKVKFTVPSQTYSGDALAGQLTYAVVVGKDTLASGTCEPGKAVTATVNVKKSGNTKFEVSTKNAAGRSPISDMTKWIGYDNPSKPKDAKFNCAGTVATVTWQAPDTAMHGGYFDGKNLSYDIVRYPDSTVVAKGLKTYTYSESLPADTFTKFSFGIVAVNGGMASDTTLTNAITVGPAYDVPYKEDFNTGSAFDQYNTIDVNNDKKYEENWGYVIENSGYWDKSSSGNPIYRGGDNAADDWLITPGINLKAGKTYLLTFDSYKDVDRYKEVFAVGIGSGLDYANYKILADTVNAHAEKYGTDSITFTVDKDGVYNIGFHAISAGHQSYIYLDNISLMEATSTGISSVITGDNDFDDSKVYTTSGIYLGKAADVLGSMPRGTYIIRKGGKSIKILK